jgi:16S rRNA processing protein RimM
LTEKQPLPGRPARPDEDRLVFIGTLSRTQGIQGGIRLMPEFDDLDDFEDLKTERLFIKPVLETAGLRAKATGAAIQFREITIREFQAQHRFLVLFFEEAPDMTTAEFLRGHEVYVYEDELWDLPEGKYYAWQLAGLELFDLTTNQAAGTVIELKPGVQDYLVVNGPERQFLVPYVPEIIKSVDLQKKQITAALPEGIAEI